jgi:hypothetical protein
LELAINLIIVVGASLLAQAQKPHAQADSAAAQPRAPALASAPAAAAATPSDGPSPWYIILNGPQDLDELWRKLERPDLVVIKGDQLAGNRPGDGRGGGRDQSIGYLAESVKVRGRVGNEAAKLTVELTIVLTRGEAVWVPIRLDDQKLTGAREGDLELSLRKAPGPAWQVRLAGPGEHRIEVDLRVPVSVDPARKSLSVAIVEAAITSVELVFAQPESDIIVGANEDFGQQELAGGKGSRLTAHLSPRSKLDVSWANNADPGTKNPPVLTAQGGIAIDIDAEQVRMRSSWSIRCIRGAARMLEIGINDQDEVTELQLDDQVTYSGNEWVRSSGKLTIRLAEPLRPGAETRLVMKTRRALTAAVARRISFTGFPVTHARDQSGAIGVTESANLWVAAASSQGLRRITPGELPTELRKRPSTRLAFEFLDQPFLLDLGVEASPPLVRAESRTFFEIAAGEARSETMIELEWARGRLFEVELGASADLELVSVGPTDVVESSHLTAGIAGRNSGKSDGQDRRLKIGLTPLASGRNRATIRLAGVQRIPPDGSIKLGLFTPDRPTSASASYALAADRGLALELDDQSGRLTGISESKRAFQGQSANWRLASARREISSPVLYLSDDGSSRFLPIRITRLPRSLSHESLVSAHVTARTVDLVQRTTVAVRNGALSSVEIRVPPAIGERWELLEKERIERVDLGREPDGSMRCRLSFDQPVPDRTILRFRYRIPLAPGLQATSAREVTIPWISVNQGLGGPVKVALSLAPEIVMQGASAGWIRSLEDVRVEPASEGSTIQFVEENPGGLPRPFAFKALALESLPLPPFVIPRLLIKTVGGSDSAVRSTAWFWVETHGPDFPFALPDGARWIGARVDGRIAGQVDYEPSRSQYRLRFSSDVGSRPVLVELQYQGTGPDAAVQFRPPRLLDGGVVLQSLWELRLPWSQTLVGIPLGWSDENEWYWSGYVWKRRPWKNPASLNEWILGPGVSPSLIDDFSGSSSDDSDRYLFSRSGQPAPLSTWIVPRAWLVGVCSGATLLVGFVVIFAKIRVRTIWLGFAVLGLLAAVLVQPTVTLLAAESASIGAALAILGLLIEGLLERWKSHAMVVGRPSAAPSPSSVDSSFKRAATVGSDDSTAIRVRVPSTQDYLPVSITSSPLENEARSSTVERG